MRAQQFLLAAGVVAALLCSVPASAQGGENITVRGHWVMTVRDANGAVVEQRAFDNHLVGASLLPRILAHSASPGSWMVWLESFTSPGPFVAGTNFLLQGGALSVGSASGALVLTGTAKAANNGAIEAVKTTIAVCEGSISPLSCRNGDGWATREDFTSTTIHRNGTATPLSLEAGQSVDVTVTISFSSTPPSS